MQRYDELMDDKEWCFLLHKEEKQRKGFYKVFRILMVISFVLPYLFAWYTAADGVTNAFSYTRFFIIAGNLLFVSGASTYCTYRVYFRKLQRDLKFKTKTIETIHITRKLHVPQNDAYFFFLDSATKLSIEVSLTDFHNYEPGDELNIEYSSYSREYFGYF